MQFSLRRLSRVPICSVIIGVNDIHKRMTLMHNPPLSGAAIITSLSEIFYA